MNPTTGLNATFAGAMARPGNVGFLSQSGAHDGHPGPQLRGERRLLGFRQRRLHDGRGVGDLIYYLGDDRKTESILIYMESVGDARSFFSAAREVALTKPIIVIKAGAPPPPPRGRRSHTGSLTGSDEARRRVHAQRRPARGQRLGPLRHGRDPG